MQQELRKCKKPKTSKRFGFTCYEDLNTLIASFAAVKSFLQYIYLKNSLIIHEENTKEMSV
jgi:hypothetical protein